MEHGPLSIPTSFPGFLILPPPGNEVVSIQLSGVSACTPLYLYLVAWPSLYVPYLCATAIASSFSFILVFQFFDFSLPLSVQSWKKNLKISTQTPVKMNWIHWFRLRLSKTRSCLGVEFTTFLRQKIFVTLSRVLFHPRSLKERLLQSMPALFLSELLFFPYALYSLVRGRSLWTSISGYIFLRDIVKCLSVFLRLLRLISLLQSWYYPHICGALFCYQRGSLQLSVVSFNLMLKCFG